MRKWSTAGCFKCVISLKHPASLRSWHIWDKNVFNKAFHVKFCLANSNIHTINLLWRVTQKLIHTQIEILKIIHDSKWVSYTFPVPVSHRYEISCCLRLVLWLKVMFVQWKTNKFSDTVKNKFKLKMVYPSCWYNFFFPGWPEEDLEE